MMPATKAKIQLDEPVSEPQSNGPRNTILHADALKALADLPAGQVDLTVFSPPYDGIRDYGKNWMLDYRTLGSELFRATTDGGVCAVVIGDGTKDFAKSLNIDRSRRER
ncbi:MAG: hypothetical protein IT438_01410 [Phycisphaerales bacterium]|nr:hypothetical protein [Phycisphaerales bacterium]